MKKITLLLLFIGSALTYNVSAQCTSFSGGGPYNNFNTTFGGAPCDSGSGCALNEITTFEIWADESYLMDNVIAGNTYIFSTCNGPNAGSWPVSFTIIAPSGAIDAFGLDAGSTCALTFTASESGTYEIGISEAGIPCDTSTNTATNNGYPAITCGPGSNSCATCTSPALTFTDFTTTTVDFTTDAVGNYEVEWGEFPYTQGNGGSTGTITAGDTFQITTLTPGVSYNVFVRQDCGAVDGFSTWTELVVGTSPDLNSLPLTEDLEPAANQALLLNFGLSFFAPTGDWSFGQDDTTDGDTTNDFANSGVSYLFSNSTFTDAAADATFYIGPFDLTTANEYTFMFMQRNLAAASATRPNKDIEIVVATTNDGTTNTVIATLDDLDNITYQQRMATFTPSSDGAYFFGVRDKSALLTGVTQANVVILDDLSITSQLSTNDFEQNAFSHIYNKTSKTLTLESSNLEMTNIEIYSILGQNVISKPLSNTREVIDVASLNDGVYLAKVFADGGYKTIKFVKN